MTSFDSLIQPFLDFVGRNPALATLVTFLAAFSEAIPVLGAVVPGTAIVLGLGALVGLGHLPLWPILVAAILGAVAGDGLAYWFGHRYKAHALEMWPLSRFPAMIGSSERFFVRHGAKSVAIARFTPVVRAFIPLLAGIAGMGPGRFYAANVASAVAWAPLHVLPGAAVGASLGALGGMSGRVLALLGLAALAGLLLFWLTRLVWQYGFAVLGRAQDRLLVLLAGRKGRLASLTRDLIDPEKPAVRSVVLLGGILAAVVLVFVNLIEGVLGRGELTRSDAAVSHLVTGLRTAWADQALVFVTTLADTPITAAVGLATAIWVWWLGRRHLAFGLAVLVAVTALFALGLKATTHIPRPNPIYTGAVEFSFPSGHATFAAAIYGVLGWLVARDLDRPWRTMVLGGVSGLIAAVAVSRIYLGAHWPSDVTAGLLYGMGATAVFALVFQAARLSPRERLTTAAAALSALVLIGGWHVSRSYAVATARYTPAAPGVTTLSEAEWRSGAWQRLPSFRVELGGDREDPLVLQWAGDAPALAAAVAPLGWRAAPEIGLTTLDRYLTGGTGPADLPALPKLNDGHAPDLVLVRPISAVEREVMRVWTSRIAVAASSGPRTILVASIERESITHPLGLLTGSREQEGQQPDLTALAAAMPHASMVLPQGTANEQASQTLLALP